MSSMPVRYTKQQKQEQKSRNQFAERIGDFGWIVNPTTIDLGEDFFVSIYEKGASTGLTFLVQLKSTSRLASLRHSAKEIAYSLKVKDLKHWSVSAIPVVIVVWDVQAKNGMWITVNDAVAQLEQRLPKWQERKQVQIRIRVGNKTDDAGLWELRRVIADIFYPIVSKGKDLLITPKFAFPKTPEGITAFESLKRHIETGDEVTITGQFVQDFHISDWWTRLYGEIEFTPEGEITLGPAASDKTIPATLEIKTGSGRGATIQYLELRDVKRGTVQITLTNEHQQYPLHFRIAIGVSNHQIELSMKFEAVESNTKMALEAMEFLTALRVGGKGRLAFLPNRSSIRFDLPRQSVPEMTTRALEVFRKLALIEDKFSVAFVLAEGWEIENGDFEMIEELWDVIATGRSLPRRATLTFNAKKAALPTLIEAARSLQPFHMRLVSDESHIALLGRVIEMGQLTRYIKGRMANPIEELELFQQRSSEEQELQIKIVDAEVVDEFENWLPKSDPSQYNETDASNEHAKI